MSYKDQYEIIFRIFTVIYTLIRYVRILSLTILGSDDLWASRFFL